MFQHSQTFCSQALHCKASKAASRILERTEASRGLGRWVEELLPSDPRLFVGHPCSSIDQCRFFCGSWVYSFGRTSTSLKNFIGLKLKNINQNYKPTIKPVFFCWRTLIPPIFPWGDHGMSSSRKRSSWSTQRTSPGQAVGPQISQMHLGYWDIRGICSWRWYFG